MKRIIIIAALSLMTVSLSAQSDILNALKSVASSVVSSAVTTDLKGTTWTYQGVATALRSDNVLTSAAGTAALSTVETKINNAFSKVGIKAGSATLKFEEDGDFTMTFGKVPLTGTWTQDGTAVTIKFGKALTYLQLDGTVSTTTDGCKLLFDGEKFLTFAKKVISTTSSKSTSSTLKSLSSVLTSAKSIDAGFNLSK